MKKILALTLVLTSALTFSSIKQAKSTDQQYYWMKISAQDKFQRSVIANTGAAIEIVQDDYVIAYGNDIELEKIRQLGWLQAASNLADEKDFPIKDSIYHNYNELTTELQQLANKNPDLVQLSSIAKTTEGRDIWALRISSDLAHADQKAAAIYMGRPPRTRTLICRVTFNVGTIPY